MANIRLKDVRSDYYSGNITWSGVEAIFETWVKQDDYCVLAYPKEDAQTYIDNHGRHVCTEHEYYGFKCAKRGNDVYRARNRTRFEPIMGTLLDMKSKFPNHFNDRTFKGNMLSIVLTYDTKRKTKNAAWSTIASDINLFITRMRKEFGCVGYVRSLEAFKNGYPHCHIDMILDKTYRFKRHRGKGGHIRFLLSKKNEAKIQSFYPDLVKVQGAYSLGLIGYNVKYILKHIFSGKCRSTLARCWLHGLRQFAISSKFLDKFLSIMKRLVPISIMHNSNKLVEKIRKTVFPRTSPCYVGVITLPYERAKGAFLLRMRPPPPQDKPAEQIYKTNSEWIQDGSIATLRCMQCGNPIFDGEQEAIEGACICKKCYEEL